MAEFSFICLSISGLIAIAVFSSSRGAKAAGSSKKATLLMLVSLVAGLVFVSAGAAFVMGP